jgi:V/A-type H+-transporting ATPase subunit B
MGFKLSRWDEKLLKYSHLFVENMMNLEVNIELEKALDLGWKILSTAFLSQEVGIKEKLIEKYWPG